MQLRTSNSIKFFDGLMRNKFKFTEYTNREANALFFGIYSNTDLKELKRHAGGKMVLLNGSDSMQPQRLNEIVETGAVIIAGSQWVQKDLIAIGYNDFESISFFFGDVYDWNPVPLGDSLYWYGGNQSKYGKYLVPEVRKRFPDLDIIILDNNSVPRDQMAGIYKGCFAGIRPVEHDGSAQTVGELALMGRPTIWNGGTKFARGYKSKEDIFRHIEELRRKKFNPSNVAAAARRFYINNEIAWCSLLLYYFGTNEIDTAGIFEEDEGRCGSIFRIQRRSDIEKIGGMGTEQFERPWFSEQMKKLGKKQLISSKNSGVVASEWKFAGNKGYPEGFKPRTYDEKYG